MRNRGQNQRLKDPIRRGSVIAVLIRLMIGWILILIQPFLSSLLSQVVNRHPAADPSSNLWPFRVGVAEDRNKRWRRSMEDAHAFVYDFGGVQGQGFFSVFDGHAGKQCAEWCGKHFHEHLLETLIASQKEEPVPDLLNQTFHKVDEELAEMSSSQGTSSGCTAVTCFLRLEDENGVPLEHAKTGGVDPSSSSTGPGATSGFGGAAATEDEEASKKPSLTSSSSSSSNSGGGLFGSLARKMKKPSDTSSNNSSTDTPTAKDPSKQEDANEPVEASSSTGKPRRVLYTANVGDARAVLSRKGQAVRLTYDHKASDAQEAKRITDAGGFVMNNRVNAVLAVTRSLGDSSMKEFVVGAPYTTETRLTEEDTFLIVACDGLWDVVDDQDAVDLIRDIDDAQMAAQKLLAHALSNFSTDNTSVMVVKFNVDGKVASMGKAATEGEETSEGPGGAGKLPQRQQQEGRESITGEVTDTPTAVSPDTSATEAST